MSIPVINTTQSVLGYKQWQPFNYQPYATNNPLSWECPNLPQGLSIDTPAVFSATGVEATDVITATGNTFANGDAVYFPSLTGGAGLSANAIYYVRDKSTDDIKLAATKDGAAIDFTTDISAAEMRKVSTGLISGAAEVAGVFVIALTAINGDGTSDPLVLTIGIEPAPASLTSSGYEVEIDVVTRKLSLVGGGDVNLFAKQNDSLLLWIRFKKEDQILDLDIDTLSLALKEFEPEKRIILGNAFVKKGSGSGAIYGLYCDMSGDDLANVLANYESDAETAFDGITEIEWQEVNSDYGSGFGPEKYRFTTQNFPTKIARDMVQAA